MTDLRLSRMLGRERTSVTKLRARLQAPKDSSAATWQDVVFHLAVSMKDMAPDAADPQEEPDTAKSGPAWVEISRLLLERFKSNWSFEAMREYAQNTLRMSPDVIKSVIERYRELVLLTELDDFEPSSSEILRPFSSLKKGLIRGHAERDRFIASTQKWTESTPSRKASLVQLLHRWEQKVDAEHPRIVCVNQSELDQAKSILESLGLEASTLRYQIHGDPKNAWLEGVLLKTPGCTLSESRASRGSHRILTTEVSIAVAQSAGQNRPDGRDLHRALIALSVATSVA